MFEKVKYQQYITIGEWNVLTNYLYSKLGPVVWTRRDVLDLA